MTANYSQPISPPQLCGLVGSDLYSSAAAAAAAFSFFFFSGRVQHQHILSQTSACRANEVG